jgi:hypothetical protein
MHASVGGTTVCRQHLPEAPKMCRSRGRGFVARRKLPQMHDKECEVSQPYHINIYLNTFSPVTLVAIWNPPKKKFALDLEKRMGMESINAEDFISETEASRSCGIMSLKPMQLNFLKYLTFFQR